jgi:hypothetical protein
VQAGLMLEDRRQAQGRKPDWFVGLRLRKKAA